MHVVLNQQLKLGVSLPFEDYLVSINEQIGFAMEQISARKGLGASLWKSAKYVDLLQAFLDRDSLPINNGLLVFPGRGRLRWF